MLMFTIIGAVLVIPIVLYNWLADDIQEAAKQSGIKSFYIIVTVVRFIIGICILSVLWPFIRILFS